MSKKNNNFIVKDVNENKIIIEEERKERSPFAAFFVQNGKLIFAISSLFSITVLIIALYFVISNMKESSIVMYEDNGVVVKFNGTDNSILNGASITNKYAEKVFNNVIKMNDNVGVVIEVDRKSIKYKKDDKKVERIIVYYSDGTALVKDSDGTYTRVFSIDGKSGIDKNGIIDSRAKVKDVSGVLETNKNLGISLLYLSDGSIEISKDNAVFFIRNSDITNTKDVFYTNLSGVSLPIDKINGNTHYSDGTIKENNGIIIDGKRYEKVNKVNVYDNIKIIYYENGYAEIQKDNLSIMVKNSNHIMYDDNILEIVENVISDINVKDIMDIKEIELDNTNSEKAHYIIVIEETSNYNKYNVNKMIDTDIIHFNVYANGKKTYNNVLNNNIKDSNVLEGISFENNTYVIYEGVIDSMSSTMVKLGFWIDYVEDRVTNEYMNSAFIGTVKVYIEEVN